MIEIEVIYTALRNERRKISRIFNSDDEAREFILPFAAFSGIKYRFLPIEGVV